MTYRDVITRTNPLLYSILMRSLRRKNNALRADRIRPSVRPSVRDLVPATKTFYWIFTKLGIAVS
jgi:hypothetical protein